jgi:alpha-tubulin suppressor-like RCC1 family protein
MKEREVWAWGGSGNGETGIGMEDKVIMTPSPVPFSFPEKITKVFCRGYHSLFLGEEGTLWACGYNFFESTGVGIEKMRVLTPEVIFLGEGEENFREVSTGWSYSMILLEDGDLRVWGSNRFGQLLLSSTQYTPVLLEFPPDGNGEKEEGKNEEEEAGLGCYGDNLFAVTGR